jgi:hypothetical protein
MASRNPSRFGARCSVGSRAAAMAELLTECAMCKTGHRGCSHLRLDRAGCLERTQSVAEDLIPSWRPSSRQSWRPSCNRWRSVSRGSKLSCSRCDSSRTSKLNASRRSKSRSKHSPKGASQGAHDQGARRGQRRLRTAPDLLNRTETIASPLAAYDGVTGGVNADWRCHAA